jgi:hypothetical protein
MRDWLAGMLSRLVDPGDERPSYRRLVVLALATSLLLGGVVGERTWLWVALVFVGGEAAQRLAARITRPR